MDTISSNFSVNAMANPPSLGTMIPTTKAPKIAWTPMISVKNAEPKTVSMVTVMKNMVGPLSRDPVDRASHNKAAFTGKRRKSVHPTQHRSMYNAVRPEPAFTNATLNAKRTQPTENESKKSGKAIALTNQDVLISFATPAESTTIPTVVSSSCNSVRMRHSTGKAVIENATPVNSMKWVNSMLESMNSLYRGTANPAPMPKGTIIPARATVTESRALRLMTVPSISRPTRKRKRHRPMLATRDR